MAEKLFITYSIVTAYVVLFAVRGLITQDFTDRQAKWATVYFGLYLAAALLYGHYI